MVDPTDRRADGSNWSRRTYLATGAAGLLSLGVANASGAGDETEVDRPRNSVTEIDRCTTITEPGRYALTADLEVEPDETCLEIRTSNVVLDGRGHAIRGTEETGEYDAPSSDSIGLLVALGERNGNGEKPKRIEETDRRAEACRPSGRPEPGAVTVANLTVENCGTGIATRGLDRGQLLRTVARENYDGIVLEETARTLCYRNATVDNIRGIRLRSSDANSLLENRAQDRGDGISLEGSRANTLDRNEAVGNDPFGIVLEDSDGNTITNNTANGNFVGISARSSRANTIARNTANGNVDGISCGGADGNAITDNTVRENSYFGVVLTGSDENTISRNVAADNAPYAYHLLDSSRNTGRANTSGGGAIEISGGSGNRIEIDGVWYTEGDATDGVVIEQVQTQAQQVTAAIEELEVPAIRARLVEYLEETGRGRLAESLPDAEQ